MSVDCGGLASAWIDEAGFFALTMASKLPSAKKYQRWVFSELAEQMTDMLPSSALFNHFSLSDSVSVLKCSHRICPQAALADLAVATFHRGINLEDLTKYIVAAPSMQGAGRPSTFTFGRLLNLRVSRCLMLQHLDLAVTDICGLLHRRCALWQA